MLAHRHAAQRHTITPHQSENTENYTKDENNEF
jgi:hypothetical protein